MKMPPLASEAPENGMYDFVENSLLNASDEENPGDDFEAQQENDFAEYMWMEHEEEFDKEVIQRLEEEALMEECMAYMSSENELDLMEEEASRANSLMVTSKLNPEAAEFVPSTRREPPLEEDSESTDLP